MKEINLYLRRRPSTEYTEGQLYFEAEEFCNTLEDPVRELKDLNGDGDFDDPGEGKIYGDTAIPAGRYEVVLTWSPKFKRQLPLLLDVPGFTGIRIHALNDKTGTQGCIGVGRRYAPGRICNARITETALIERLRAYEKDCRIFITISE